MYGVYNLVKYWGLTKRRRVNINLFMVELRHQDSSSLNVSNITMLRMN